MVFQKKNVFKNRKRYESKNWAKPMINSFVRLNGICHYNSAFTWSPQEFFLERGIEKESQRKRDRDRNKSVFHMTTNKFVCVCLIKWKCVLNM